MVNQWLTIEKPLVGGLKIGRPTVGGFFLYYLWVFFYP